MSCEGACAHVRCAVACVRAKSILKSVQDVRATCFRHAMCDHNFAHFLKQKDQKMLLFVLKTILGHPILL